MAGIPTRRGSIVLALTLALAALAGGCGSASGPTAAANSAPCDHWCGNGSATVTFGGTTETITGGGCYDRGSAGVDARFGDWQDQSGFDYLALTAYRVGGPTPPPAQPGSSAADQPAPVGGGSVGGNTFILDSTATVTLDAGGHGAFSGMDANGGGSVKGTFNCG
jgi:hypothetical protein